MMFNSDSFFFISNQADQIAKPGLPKSSIAAIHPSLINHDRLRYYRSGMLMDMGMIPDKNGGGVGDKFLLDMFHWSKCVFFEHTYCFDLPM